MQRLVEQAEPIIPSVGEIQRRRYARRRRRQLAAGCAVAVVLAGAVSVIAAVARDDGTSPTIHVGPPSTPQVTVPQPGPTSAAPTTEAPTRSSLPPVVPTTVLPIAQGTLAGVPDHAYAALAHGVARI